MAIVYFLPNCIYLVHVVVIDGSIETRVQVIQQVHNFEGCGIGRNRCEAIQQSSITPSNVCIL